MNEVNYVFWIIMLIFVFAPLYLVGASIIIDDNDTRKYVLISGGVCGCVWFTILFYMQMNIEFIYGKELLDYWYATNP